MKINAPRRQSINASLEMTADEIAVNNRQVARCFHVRGDAGVRLRVVLRHFRPRALQQIGAVQARRPAADNCDLQSE
jgi:hypothetical protein